MSNNDDPVTIEKMMDELAARYAQTRDPKIRAEILRLVTLLPPKAPPELDS